MNTEEMIYWGFEVLCKHGCTCYNLAELLQDRWPELSNELATHIATEAHDNFYEAMEG